MVSTDLSNWKELPIALAPSDNQSDPDANGVWTGSVIFTEGTFHIFYTGYLKDAAFPQTICHATSGDGIHFKKNPNNPILLPDVSRYESIDWRDPFVFWNDQENIYWMLIAARLREGLPNLRGCIALATSPDLQKWTIHDPLYTPNTTFCPECPELFQMGKKWYLVYSRFSESAQTIYRIADGPRGPWRTPLIEGLDGRRWYAAKSLGDGKRRISFGWVHERDGFTDEGTWEWGGDFCIPRELFPKGNNEIGVRYPREVLSSFGTDYPIDFSSLVGHWDISGISVTSIADGQLSYSFISVPSRRYLYKCTLLPQDIQGVFGILLNAKSDLSSAHVIAFDPGYQRVSIIRWPEPLDAFWRDLTSRKVPEPDPDGPRLVDRPIIIRNGVEIKCEILMTDTILEVFIDDEISLSHRIYDPGDYGLGLFVQGGQVTFKSLTITTP